MRLEGDSLTGALLWSSTKMPALDPIEAEMSTEQVVARDKFVGRAFQWAAAIPGIVFGLIAIGGLVIGATMAGAASIGGWVAAGVGGLLAAMFAFGWATMTVIRTALTRTALIVKCGLWGPEIPLSQITACRVDQEPGRRGVSKRLEPGGWITRFVMAGGDHVLVQYRTADGKSATLRFSAADPVGLVRKIQAQREAAAGQRIEAGNDRSEEDLEQHAEIEAEAASERSHVS